ncbi:MAG: hypothetical protein Nkreftii_002665 [Candidatus Nitrospira kreftii]|uniref:Uncharacterized protein n=1 Tax=Candidatus Nitrospira kreftii TaxID=2652173 RepID=A0A7S8J030_9BACT|nr:MAG: hypothetical protein Nkreftii_002665 [Candidatus Nitrospira kreftii]
MKPTDFLGNIGAQVVGQSLTTATGKVWERQVKPRLIKARAEVQFRQIPATLRSEQQKQRDLEIRRQEEARIAKENKVRAEVLAKDKQARDQAILDRKRQAVKATTTAPKSTQAPSQANKQQQTVVRQPTRR